MHYSTLNYKGQVTTPNKTWGESDYFQWSTPRPTVFDVTPFRLKIDSTAPAEAAYRIVSYRMISSSEQQSAVTSGLSEYLLWLL